MIRITAEAGYDAIEPWVSELDAAVAAGTSLAELKSRMADQDLRAVNLIGFFEWASPDAAVRKKALEEARRNFAQAQAIGCPYVAAAPMGIHEMPDLDLLCIAERYAKLIDLGREFNVIPVVEFWGVAKTLGKLGEVLMVAAECGRPEACILADVFHMYKGSGHFQGLNLAGPDTIAIFHMNDYPANPARADITDSDRVYPGDGIAPYPEIMAFLKKAGFSGVLSLELFTQSYWEQDAALVARTGLEKMRRAVEGA